jgi:hypothetical protein
VGIGSGLVEMAFEHGNGGGEVCSDLFGGELRPSSEMTSVYSSAPSGDGRREHGSVVERHSIGNGLCDGSGDGVDLVGSIGWLDGEVDGPEAIVGRALTGEEKRVMEVDLDVSLAESDDATVVVADKAN